MTPKQMSDEELVEELIMAVDRRCSGVEHSSIADEQLALEKEIFRRMKGGNHEYLRG